jgi:hypothetical protein
LHESRRWDGGSKNEVVIAGGISNYSPRIQMEQRDRGLAALHLSTVVALDGVVVQSSLLQHEQHLGDARRL